MTAPVPPPVSTATPVANPATDGIPAVSFPPLAVGKVVDDLTGLGIANARVEVVGTDVATTTDANGRFTLSAGVAPGTIRLRIAHDGYQPAFSTSVVLRAGREADLTLALERVQQGAGRDLRTLATTTTNASQSLQKSSTIYRTIPVDSLLASGTYRAGDALRELPGVNNGITGDTAALGDDLQLSLRGIGTLETIATLDGHPIGEGAKGGYNYQLTPIFALRGITVDYGSGGSDIFGLNAIGGIVDQETLDPTPGNQFSFNQGFGTFSRLSSSFSDTGTAGRLGYAVAAGVSTVDGPLKDDYYYQPGAAYDQSATDPAVRDLAVYKDDSTLTQRAALVKLRYEFDPNVHLTLTHTAMNSWNDKTGNGDADDLPANTALALGNQQLTNKAATDPCPAGSFTATNANGVPNGTGPGGTPDGGMACQTPAEYAAYNTGLQGAGPSYQAIDADDEALRLDAGIGTNRLRVDAFTNRYLDTVDRYYALPFLNAPGDSPQGFVTNGNVVESGTSISDVVPLPHNDVSFGFTYLNNAYNAQRDHALTGAPIYHDTAFFLADAARFDRDRFAVYANAWFKRSTATNTSYVDPRLSLVYSPTQRDVFRVSSGADTAQPLSNELGQGFSFNIPGGAGGGAAISCTSPNSLGAAPSSVLKPERGVDDEIAYGHHWYGDSQVQFSFYNTNVYDKIYSTTVPLTQTGTAFIPPAELAAAAAAVQARCGQVDPTPLLGVTGNLNVGQLRAQGFELTGRQRLTPRLYIDYDYDLTSTVLVSAPTRLFQSNTTLIQGSQLPRLPLHTAMYALDGTLPHDVELRYTVHTVSVNNTKALPAYNYSDLLAQTKIGPGVVDVSVSNLFQQDAFIDGLRGDGVPLALNQYAKASAYTPLIGTAATEEFGLPYRQIFFGYTLQVK